VGWKTVPQTNAATGNALSPTVDRRVRYVERPETLMRQNVMVVWLECLLVDVVSHMSTDRLTTTVLLF